MFKKLLGKIKNFFYQKKSNNNLNIPNYYLDLTNEGMADKILQDEGVSEGALSSYKSDCIKIPAPIHCRSFGNNQDLIKRHDDGVRFQNSTPSSIDSDIDIDVGLAEHAFDIESVDGNQPSKILSSPRRFSQAGFDINNPIFFTKI